MANPPAPPPADEAGAGGRKSDAELAVEAGMAIARLAVVFEGGSRPSIRDANAITAPLFAAAVRLAERSA